jgi:hypothetical protein
MVSPTVAGDDPERFVRLFVEGQSQILRYILSLVPDVDDAHESLLMAGLSPDHQHEKHLFLVRLPVPLVGACAAPTDFREFASVGTTTNFTDSGNAQVASLVDQPGGRRAPRPTARSSAPTSPEVEGISLGRAAFGGCSDPAAPGSRAETSCRIAE